MRSVGRVLEHICVLALSLVLGSIFCCVLKPPQDCELPTRGQMGGALGGQEVPDGDLKTSCGDWGMEKLLLQVRVVLIFRSLARVSEDSCSPCCSPGSKWDHNKS